MYRSAVECLSSMCEVLGSVPGAGREGGTGKGRGISSGFALHPCPVIIQSHAPGLRPSPSHSTIHLLEVSLFIS